MDLNLTKDFLGLTEFRAMLGETIARIEETRRPLVLTKGGKPSAVVMDVQSYQDLCDALRHVDLLSLVEGLKQAEGEMARRTRSEPEQEAQIRVYEVRWTDRALDTFDEAWAWIAETNEEKADEFQVETLQRIEQLEELPLLGPIVSEMTAAQSTAVPELIAFLQDKRQLVISKSHRAIYRVDEENLVVYILLIHPTRLPLSRLLREPEPEGD